MFEQLHWSLHILIPILVTAALLVLRGLTTNAWIRKRLSLGFLFAAGALFVSLVPLYSGIEPDVARRLREIEYLLILGALIVTAVVLLFNPFREDRVSDKYPHIVQDTIVIGCFALLAVAYGGDRFVTASAVGALVLGLALQDTLGNLFSGLALQAEKPFFVGNWVRMAQLEGRVIEVTWRATKIRTKAGNFISIPNSTISKDNIVNYSHPSPVLRLEKTIGLGYDAHPNRVKKVILETMRDIPGILKEPAPDVLLDQYADFSLNYRCRFWIDDFSRSEPITDGFTTLLYYRLRRAGLSVPYPVRDVRVSRPVRRRTQARHQRRLQFVEKVDFFASLSPEEKSAVGRSLTPVTFAAEEAIVRQGEIGDSMYFLLSGEARILIEKEGVTSQFATVGAGDYLGEMALLTGEPRSATARANGDVRAYMLDKERFRPVLVQHPEIAEKICAVVARRREQLVHSSTELQARQPSTKEVERSFLNKIQRFFGLT